MGNRFSFPSFIFIRCRRDSISATIFCRALKVGYLCYWIGFRSSQIRIMWVLITGDSSIFESSELQIIIFIFNFLIFRIGFPLSWVWCILSNITFSSPKFPEKLPVSYMYNMLSWWFLDQWHIFFSSMESMLMLICNYYHRYRFP